MNDEYQHPAFPPPPHPDVSLWRYLDLDKFDWLVNCRRLFMPAAHFLGDPLEGTTPVGHLKWCRLQAENAKSEEQRQIIEKNRELLLSFAKAFRSNYYVSCWHMNELESNKMWRCYTKTPEAVAVRTTYRLLRAALPPATKELGSSHFQNNHFEFKTQKGFLVFAPEVDVSHLVHAVILHPESTSEFAATIVSTCESAGLPSPVVSAFSTQGATSNAL